MHKIKRGDTVIVRVGKDKGKKGKVLRVILDRGLPNYISKVIVEGINLVKKNKKGDPSKNIPGGITVKEAPIDRSNIALLNPTTHKPDKVGFKFIEKNNVRVKVRYFKSNQEVVDVE